MKYIYKSILTAIVCFFLVSCQNLMNYDESSEYTKEQLFGSFQRIGNLISNLYSYLENGYSEYGNGAVIASACDEAEFAISESNIHQFHNGAWSSLNPLTSTWEKSYAGIRTANFFLDNWQDYTFEDFKYNKEYQEEMERYCRYQYEVRFLRAYLYFNLVKTYGDVPLIKKSLTTEEANNQSRTSSSEVFSFIMDECDQIENQLPVDYSNLPFAETGRITKQMVVALKARAAMYAASPLFNPSDDKTLWQYAAVAQRNAVDTCVKYGGSLVGQYNNIWGPNNYNKPEIILARRMANSNTFEATNFPVGLENAKSGNCPTQNLVDAYEIQKGMSADPEDPYKNRDKRFDLTIVYNGVTKWPTYNTYPIETFEGGRNGFPLANATPTGYYLKKYCDASVDLRPNTSTTTRHTWVIFRLGEFYLNYAECLFKMTGSPTEKPEKFTLSPLDAINKLRNRGNVPALTNDITPDEFWKRYMNERMVELAFEGHRFWDIRRWKQGKLAENIKLMKLTKNSDGTINYTPETRIRPWDDKMYLFPISDEELRKNPNLTQNPGWE